MRKQWTWRLAALATIAPGVVQAADMVVRDQAEVHALAGGRLLYRESHYMPAGGAERWVLYRCPDGRPFARKHVPGSSPAMAPDFMLEDGRDGYREGVRGGNGKRVVYAGGMGKVSSRALPVPRDGVIDAGFDAAVRTHWNALLRGDAVDLRFLVPSRKQFFPVRVQRIAADDRTQATDAMWLRMRLATWFGFAVPDVTLAYGVQDRRLRIFSGTGNVRDTRGRNPQVRIVFAPQAGVATLEEFTRMKGLPLDGRCPF